MLVLHFRRLVGWRLLWRSFWVGIVGRSGIFALEVDRVLVLS